VKVMQRHFVLSCDNTFCKRAWWYNHR